MIGEREFDVIYEADKILGKFYRDNIDWDDAENIKGVIETEHLIDIIEDLTKEVKDLQKLIKEIKEYVK